MALKAGRRGSTVVELLVSLFIFVVAYLTLMGMVASGRRAAVQARNTTMATELARDLLEQTRFTAYDAIVSAGETPVSLALVLQNTRYALTFYRRLDVASALAGKGKSLLVTVRWQEGRLWHQVVLRTYVAQP